MRTCPSVYSAFCLCIALVSACGASDGGSSGAGGDIGSRPFPGDDNAALADAIVNSYVAVPVADDEYSEDEHGRRVLRTGIKIVFGNSATVGQANALVNEVDAEVVATLAGHPAAVVRIPDPGTLQALEALVADIQSRGSVKSVLLSYAPVVRALPDNVYETIFQTEPNSSLPSAADEWKYVSQHLPVRGAAAWHVKALAGKPMVVVGDYFGDGDPSTTLYDIERFPGASDFGIASGGPPDSHGYEMLSIIAARHSSSFGGKDEPIWANGMLPNGARFAAVDHTKVDANVFDVHLLQRLGEIASQSQGAIIANLSIGDPCTGVSITDPCISQADLNDAVVDFINMVQVADLEDRVLFVAAAGNIGKDAPELGPVDAKSSSVYNAAGSLDGWFDRETGEEVAPLTNVLVVENAASEIAAAEVGSFQPPFEPTCIFQKSFIGGQIAGIGSAFMISGSGETPSTDYDDTANSSTSSAAAQISGLAAYLSAIRPELTPQELIRVLVTTARQPTGLSIGDECTDIDSDTPVADAYAAVLATDPPGTLDASSARTRLELLDIARDFVPLDPADPTPEVSPDGKFDIRDLRRWIDVLTGPAASEIDHGRYDLNGNGIIGEDGTAPFDLDISTDPSSSSSIAYSTVEFDFTLTPVTYDESALTDMQIVCYYAMSPLYDIVGGLDPFTAEGRAEELERVREFCEPFAVTVSPDPVTLEPGDTQQFTATVTGSENTDVTWTATGGTIDAAGSFTAGSQEGVFEVTATSVEDPSVSATASVTIAVADVPILTGYYEGTYLNTLERNGPERPVLAVVQQTGPTSYVFSLLSLAYDAELVGSQLTGESRRQMWLDGAGAFIRFDFEATVSGRNIQGFAQWYINGNIDHECSDGHCGYDFDVNWVGDTL